jgi:hypothetical protein
MPSARRSLIALGISNFILISHNEVRREASPLGYPLGLIQGYLKVCINIGRFDVCLMDRQIKISTYPLVNYLLITFD